MEIYSNLRKTVQQYASKIAPNELLQIYSFCLNHEIKLNKSKSENTNDIFLLFCEMVDNKLFESHIKDVMYISIVRHAVRASKFDWAKSFLEKYLPKVAVANEENRQYVYNEALAICYFYQKQFSEVQKLLNDTNYPDAYRYLERKILLLKSYYEQATGNSPIQEYDTEKQPDDEFEKGIIAIRTYLTRNKTIIAETNHAAISDFLTFTNSLYHIKNKIQPKQPIPNEVKQKLIFLKYKFQNTALIYDRQWLEQSINELLN